MTEIKITRRSFVERSLATGAALALPTHRVLGANSDVRVAIIGCGGIFDPGDAWSKLCAGASLVQLYTGFAYHGPVLVRRIVEDLAGRAADSGTGELAAILAAVHARIATPNPY